jgi:hypothetical protein
MGAASGTHIGLPMVKAGSQDFAVGADWVPATGDVKLSIDGAAQANITTLPSYSNGQWLFQLTAGETTGKSIRVVVVDSATKAVEDQFFVIETFGNASAQYTVDWTVAGGKLPATVAAGDIATDAITAAALAASAVTEIQAGLSTLDAAGVRTAVGLASANLDAQLGAIAGFIDTEIALLLSRLGVPTNASVAADVAAALTAILAKLPAALVAGRMDSSIGAYASGQDPATVLYDSFLVNTITFRVAFRAMAATLVGKDTKAADGSTSSFADIGDPTTTRVTATNTTTLRTPTIL